MAAVGRNCWRILSDLEASNGLVWGQLGSLLPVALTEAIPCHSLLGRIACFLNLVFFFLGVYTHFDGAPSLVVSYKEAHKS